jgi:hypothetical protein
MTDAPALTALPHLTRIGEVLEGLTRDIQDQAARATLPETRTELVADRLALTAQYLDYVRLVQQTRWAESGPDVLIARVGRALGHLAEAGGGNHGPLHLYYVADQVARDLLGPAYPEWVADQNGWLEGQQDEEPV